MRRKGHYSWIVLIVAALLVLCSVEGRQGAAALSSTPKKISQRQVITVAPQTEDQGERPSISLAGKFFSQISNDDRLNTEDAERYANIFAFQDVGAFKKADEVIHQLTNHCLMGHVLFQRYMRPDYKSSYQELADWMKRYADHPKAQKIYELALKYRPKKGGGSLPAPRTSRGMTGYHDYDSGQLAQPYLTNQKYTARERDIIRMINRSLLESPSGAWKRLDTAEARRVFDNTKYDALRAEISESYFHYGKIRDAYELSSASSNRSGKEVPLAGWIAGLAAWKQGKYEEAARHFERTAISRRASSWMASAGAHWAARSYLRSHHPEKVSYWLRKAAEYPRSFYGIISMKALGMEQAHFNWEVPELNSRLTKALVALPAGKRALALMDAERPDLAEQELRQINPGNDKTLQEAMIALAHRANMPAFEMRLGSGLKDPDGNLYDAALYPDTPWHPVGGYQVDKALVYAFIRQESKFDASASNKSSGATGLMQLLPSTAMNVARVNGIKVDRSQLHDPAVNIRLGQKYLADLLQDENVQNNLFKLAVAYNAGPGKLSRWEKTVKYEDDPLLFIESIPVAETRIFVERVLTNYWVYRLKYNQSMDSLENVASGEWPTYMAEDMHRMFSFADASWSSRR